MQSSLAQRIDVRHWVQHEIDAMRSEIRREMREEIREEIREEMRSELEQEMATLRATKLKVLFGHVPEPIPSRCIRAKRQEHVPVPSTPAPDLNAAAPYTRLTGFADPEPMTRCPVHK